MLNKDLSPLTLEDAQHLEGPEKTFALLFLENFAFPEYAIYHEPGKYEAEGVPGATLPDFLLLNQTHGNNLVTEVCRGSIHKPRKERQQEILDACGQPGIQISGFALQYPELVINVTGQLLNQEISLEEAQFELDVEEKWLAPRPAQAPKPWPTSKW